jgi:beta-1,4-mannosyltransferase
MPYPGHKERNAYLQDLVAGLETEGVRTARFSAARLMARPDAWHLHWPERYVQARGRPTRPLINLAKLAVFLVLAHLLGVRVVLTIHNLAPHEGERIGRAALALSARACHVSLHLSASARHAALDRWPTLGAKPALVTPHGTYTVESLPAPFGEGETTFGFFGAIRPYKGVPRLLHAFSELEGPYRLRILGDPRTPDLTREIKEAVAADRRMSARLEYVDDGDLLEELAGIDVVVLPYTAILNSGSAMHALSAGRPVVAPRLGSLTELAEQVGPRWMALFDGTLDAEDLRRAEASFREGTTANPGARPDLSAFSWRSIARATLAAYAETTPPRAQPTDPVHPTEVRP